MKQIICSSLVVCISPKFRNTLLTERNLLLQKIVIVNILTKIVIGIEFWYCLDLINMYHVWASSRAFGIIYTLLVWTMAALRVSQHIHMNTLTCKKEKKNYTCKKIKNIQHLFWQNLWFAVGSIQPLKNQNLTSIMHFSLSLFLESFN